MTHIQETQAPASAPVPDIGEAILSDAETHALTQLSRTTRWRMGRDGTFPLPVQLAKGRIGYLKTEVLEWLRTRPRVQPRSAA